MSTALLSPDTPAGVTRRAGFPSPSWSPRTSALIAGSALALMMVLAIFGYFVAIKPAIVPGDAGQTVSNIGDSRLLFAAGIASLVLVTLLDVVVAAALYRLFRPVSRRLSAVAAWTRVIFAVGFLVAIAQLVAALLLLDSPDDALRAAESFSTIWTTVLGIFGIHLLLVGYLEFRSGFFPRVFGILLAVSGVGYLADSVAITLLPGFAPVFGNFGFIGETASMLWLLIMGRRLARR